MKRIIVFALLAVLFVTAVIPQTGCGAKVDEAEVFARAEELIPKTALINRLFFIEGLPLKEGGLVVGGYQEVDMDEIRALGYESLEDILASMDGVWSREYIERFRSGSLFEVLSTDTYQKSKYCFDRYDSKTGVYEGIWASDAGLANHTDYVEYLYDTLEVEKIYHKNRVKVKMDAVVTDRDDPTAVCTVNISITLARVKTSAPWLLDASTAVAYRETPNP